MTAQVLHVYAGCGGSGVGLARAGWGPCMHVELDPDACATLSAAEGRRVRPCSDTVLQRVAPGLLPLRWWASPPCQPWSTAGSQHGVVDDRNRWPVLLEAVRVHRPTWLVTENVRGMLAPKHLGYKVWLQSELAKVYASVQLWVLDAADYGVPQHRVRVFLVCGPVAAARPVPTHSKATLAEDKASGAYWSQAFDGDYVPRAPGSDGKLAHVTMREALRLGRSGKVIGGGHNPNHAGDVRRYAELTDRPATTIAAQHGGGAGNAGPFVEKPDWWHRATDADEPSRAVESRANAQIDIRPIGGADSSTTRRRLTVEECAILQDFPAGYPFKGNKTAQYRQVGNAVPPRLAEVIANAINEVDPSASPAPTRR